MLQMLTRKLCPFVTLAIATVGCGKKINDPATTLSRSTQNQELPSALVLQLNTTDSFHLNYTLPRNGIFALPETLRVRTGNGQGKEVTISYNVNPYDSDDYEFKCTYRSSVQEFELPLESCTDIYGGDFGDIRDHLFMMDRNKLIRMETPKSTGAGLIMDAIFATDWK
jgi:hypothetical protein